MSFVIRAALVIGVLSWLALQRQGAATPDLSATPRAVAEAALVAWPSLSEAAREAALREGGAEFARRAGVAATPGSRDTLMDADRSLPWRGAPTRPDPKRPSERGDRAAP